MGGSLHRAKTRRSIPNAQRLPTATPQHRKSVGRGVPIYEYEPVDHDCLMCPNLVMAVQGVNDEPLQYCPDCGLEVRRIVSKAAFKLSKGGPDEAAKRGFSTFRKAEKGVWEKVAGPGVDGIVLEEKLDGSDGYGE